MFERRSVFFLRFCRRDHGNASIVLGLMTVVLLLVGGVAVDCARVVDMRNRLTNAAESVSLEASRAMRDGLSTNQIETRARSHFETDVASARKLGTIETPSITIDRSSGTVTIQVTGKVTATVSRVAGFEEIPVPVTSKTVYPQRDTHVDLATSSILRTTHQRRS